MVQVGSQKYRRTVYLVLLAYLACSQIWLNRLRDDEHLTDPTKLEEKKEKKKKLHQGRFLCFYFSDFKIKKNKKKKTSCYNKKKFKIFFTFSSLKKISFLNSCSDFSMLKKKNN